MSNLLASARLPAHSAIHRWPDLLLLTSAAVLAVAPLQWLIRSWYAPGYDGLGAGAFLLVLGLFLYSWQSGARETGAAGAPRRLRAMALILLATSIRALAQLSDIQILGALVLALDVYALAILAGLPSRRRPLAPFWLAVLFLFALPVEPMVQRLFGYALQSASAEVACRMLLPFYSDLTCDGLRLRLTDVDVLVDLPCSGARLLSQSALLFVLHSVLRPLQPGPAIIGGLLTLVTAWLVNGLRISLLAAGIAEAPRLPFQVMDPLPHQAVGLICIALAAGILFPLYQRLARSRKATTDSARVQPRPAAMPAAPGPAAHSGLQRLLSLLLLPGAILTISLEADPFDATEPLPPPEAPHYVAGRTGTADALSALERRYFTTYGGGASKTRYGPYGLLLVGTRSPLRHLHDPAVCLGGMGYRVQFLGTRFHGVPSARYRATAEKPLENGSEAYLLDVTFVSAEGRIATSISEVVWHWLVQDDAHWTMVQRIVPESIDHFPDTERWKQAIARAFNLT